MIKKIVITILVSYTFSFSFIYAKDEISETIDSTEFYYAGSKRYSIFGDLPLKNTDIKTTPFLLLTGINAGFLVGQHIYQANTIWEDQAEFKFNEDGQYALYADKAGHVFGSYYTSYVYTDLFAMTGISWELSNILGGAMGLAYTTYVEILDGYGANFGFSPSDFYADVFGAGFYVAQYYFPFLQNFTPKFTYIPATWHGDLKRQPHFAFIDDYSSHTLWMSVNVHNLLPNDINDYWPKWLQLSFGYAARNLCDPYDPNNDCSRSNPASDVAWGNRKFIIALDYNLVEIVPELGAPFDWLVQSLNYLKFPAPAIEFGETTRFSLVYPF